MPILEKKHHPMPDHNSWPVFVISGEDGSPGPTDLSYLLEKPAGAKGFITIKDGHLADGAGDRWRIWGTNLTGRMPMPSLKLAPVLARHLAKYGINCVRLHFMDVRWPNGLLMRSRNWTPRQPGDLPQRSQDETTRALDPEAMARLDYFVACLKEQGIYIDLNLNVARPFTEADGVAQAEWLGYAKAVTYFDPTLIELQKEYAAQLLGHHNPFTGTRYADEPAVALVELLNENSILESWLSDRLRGENTQPTGTWSDIPPVYGAALDQRYNAWLAAQFSSRPALAQAWQDDLRENEDPQAGTVRRLNAKEIPSASHARFASESEFYAGIERDYFADMAAYLRTEIGVKQPILGSSDHNMGKNNSLHLENLARLDLTDGHFYWQHPEFPGGGWSNTDWYIINSPMVNAPDSSVIARVSRSKVKGLPYIVSETNAPFPNDTAAGFISILGAYARFQDWDGIFPYDYNRISVDDELVDGRIFSFFATGSDPIKMAETVAAGLAFLRGDVQTARQVIDRHITREQMIEAQRVPLTDSPYWVPDLPGRLSLVHAVQIAEFNAAENLPRAADLNLPATAIVSDTGELRWEDGRVTIDTPHWQAMIGRPGTMCTANLSLDLAAPYATVQAISLDGKPLSQAGQILLITAARVANTGLTWTDDSRTSFGAAIGEAPTRIEPVLGILTFTNLAYATQVRALSLDGSGLPNVDPLPLVLQANTWVLDLAQILPSVWHLISIER